MDCDAFPTACKHGLGMQVLGSQVRRRNRDLVAYYHQSVGNIVGLSHLSDGGDESACRSGGTRTVWSLKIPL